MPDVSPETQTDLATRPPLRSCANIPPREKAILQKLILEAIRHTGQIKKSCEQVGIHVRVVYQWAESSPSFAKMLEDAQQQGEKVLLKLYEGKIDHETLSKDFDKITAILAMFRMKRLDPRYRDTTQINIENKGPAQLIFEAPPTTSSGEQPK